MSLIKVEPFLCSIKYVVVKTLIEKKQPITQIKRPHYPIWVIYSQVWNQWANGPSDVLSCIVITRLDADICESPMSRIIREGGFWANGQATLQATEASCCCHTRCWCRNAKSHQLPVVLATARPHPTPVSWDAAAENRTAPLRCGLETGAATHLHSPQVVDI